MKTQESAENYLETILLLSEKQRRVRSVDVARELDFTRPSVSISMKKLRENGDIEIDDKGFITLTPRGRARAEGVYERHRVIAGALERLGVSRETALFDACRIEHVISAETFERIKAYMEKE